MTTREDVIEKIQKELADEVTGVEVDMLENMQYSLADAILEGSKHTSKATGWGAGESMCALSAAYTAAKARGYAD